MKTQGWTEVKFHKPEDVEDNQLKYAVIMAWYDGGWLFVRHALEWEFLLHGLLHPMEAWRTNTSEYSRLKRN